MLATSMINFRRRSVAGMGSTVPDMASKETYLSAVWVVIIFIILLCVLYPTAWRNVLNGLKKREERIRSKAMFHFSHTMEAQLGGLTQAGFVLTGFYEDRRPEADGNPIRQFMPSYYVVCPEAGLITSRRKATREPCQ